MFRLQMGSLQLPKRLTGATPSMPKGGTAANINDDDTGTTATTSALGDLATGSPPPSARVIAKLDFGAPQLITQLELKGYSRSSGSAGGGSFYCSLDDVILSSLGGIGTISPTPTDWLLNVNISARYIYVVVAFGNYGSVTKTIKDLNASGYGL